MYINEMAIEQRDLRYNPRVMDEKYAVMNRPKGYDVKETKQCRGMA